MTSLGRLRLKTAIRSASQARSAVIRHPSTSPFLVGRGGRKVLLQQIKVLFAVGSTS
jgi:hypothetical protein